MLLEYKFVKIYKFMCDCSEVSSDKFISNGLKTNCPCGYSPKMERVKSDFELQGYDNDTVLLYLNCGECEDCGDTKLVVFCKRCYDKELRGENNLVWMCSCEGNLREKNEFECDGCALEEFHEKINQHSN